MPAILYEAWQGLPACVGGDGVGSAAPPSRSCAGQDVGADEKVPLAEGRWTLGAQGRSQSRTRPGEPRPPKLAVLGPGRRRLTDLARERNGDGGLLELPSVSLVRPITEQYSPASEAFVVCSEHECY